MRCVPYRISMRALKVQKREYDFLAERLKAVAPSASKLNDAVRSYRIGRRDARQESSLELPAPTRLLRAVSWEFQMPRAVSAKLLEALNSGNYALNCAWHVL